MELSPEEKKRIYEEEKVRLEAQEKAKRELKAKKTRLRSNWAFMGCLLAFSLVAMPLLAHSIDLTARSGIDSGNGCRYEGTTKREFLAAETICLGWGAIGVKQAKADGNTLKVYVDNELAEGLEKGSVYEKHSKKMVTAIAETFARLSSNRVKAVRVEFLSGDKLLLAAEGTDVSMKLLRGTEQQGKVATNCDKLVAGLPKQPFSERDQVILSEVLKSSEPEEEVLRRMANKYGITATAAKEAARRAQQGQFSDWGHQRDNAVKKAVACLVEHRGLLLVDSPIVTGGHVTIMVNSGRVATDEMQPLARDILRLPGIASTRIDLRHNGERVAIRDYP